MDKKLKFDYFYGVEADQFAFYRIPKNIIKDPTFDVLSNKAKILYGLILDRMSLSRKNGWIDKENRVFIHYKLQDIMEDLGCCKETCRNALKELDDINGIGLIERKRQGQGKPDKIYVKDFITGTDGKSPRKYLEQSEDDILRSSKTELQEAQKINFKKPKNYTSKSLKTVLQEEQKIDFKKSKNCTSKGLKNELQEVQKLDPNNNNINITKINNNHSICQERSYWEEKRKIEDAYKNIIAKNVKYDIYMEQLHPIEASRYQEMYELICDVVCGEYESMEIGDKRYSSQHVKEKFLKLTDDHLMYVMNSYDGTSTKVKSRYNYLRTSLFNAVSTMHNACQQDAGYAAFAAYE